MNKHELWNDIAKSVFGEAWHGPSVNEALAGVTAAQAANRPPNELHSIWELTLHVAAWIDEVAERVQGRFHEEPLAGNFVTVTDTSETAWQAASGEPARALTRLEGALDVFPEQRLGEEVRPGVTFGAMLSGLAQHNAYHAGQIAVLRRL